jgi:queuine/archaeosine tRNA-ribosyltransferase
MNDFRFSVICALVALFVVVAGGSACDQRKHAFYKDMADKQFCRVSIGGVELWRPCSQVNP